jgi:hypothetical protein
MTTTIQLGDGVSAVLPEAVECVGLVLPEGRYPLQLRFTLADGTELFLPVSERVARKIQAMLKGFSSDPQ